MTGLFDCIFQGKQTDFLFYQSASWEPAHSGHVIHPYEGNPFLAC